MVNVLLDARVVERGQTGIARYVQELAKRLPAAGGWLRLTSLSGAGAPPLQGAAETVRARSPFLSPLEQAELPLRVAGWRLRAPSPRVFWVPAFNAPPLAPAPLALTLHDANHLAFPDQYGRQHAVYYRTVVRAACERARVVICPSEFARREVVERVGVAPEKCRAILNGVSPPPRASPEQIEQVRAAWRLPERYALYVGNFKPHKNLAVLLRTASRWAGEVPLVLVGGREDALGGALLRARAEGAQVRALPSVGESDLWALLAGAAVFVFPSRYEGFGLPPLEAMAAGTPVVTTNAASLPEVVGDAAMTVDPDDADGMAAAVERVLSDPAQAASLVARGRERAERLGWDRCARETAAALAEAAE